MNYFYLGHDGRISIGGKGSSVVVHYTSIVIANSEGG